MHTFRQVKAEDLKPGDRWHWLGRGYLGRTVATVTPMCNCASTHGRGIDPETHAPLHYPIIEITSSDRDKMSAQLIPGMDVTVSDGAY